ncbi:hypothetical protein HY404_00370 [Candidatus Microgenomates bacterium]|nr:hypothetical protein [Candidatus Microgenomates bacterium]
MTKKLLVVLLGIFIYFSLSFFTWLFIPSPSWWLTTAVVGIITFFILFKFTKISLISRTVTATYGLMAVFLGFITAFIYSDIAHDYAMWKVCIPAIQEKYNLSPNGDNQGKDPQNQKGEFRSWYQHLECENKIMPIPWGKHAQFSENPPGWVSQK